MGGVQHRTEHPPSIPPWGGGDSPQPPALALGGGGCTFSSLGFCRGCVAVGFIPTGITHLLFWVLLAQGVPQGDAPVPGQAGTRGEVVAGFRKEDSGPFMGRGDEKSSLNC